MGSAGPSAVSLRDVGSRCVTILFRIILAFRVVSIFAKDMVVITGKTKHHDCDNYLHSVVGFHA